MYYKTELLPEFYNDGKFFFKEIPSGIYDIQISFGGYSNKKSIIIPDEGNIALMKFGALYGIKTELFNSHGEKIHDNTKEIRISRNGNKIYQDLTSQDIISLPPGEYSINVYSENELIGSKTIELKKLLL